MSIEYSLYSSSQKVARAMPAILESLPNVQKRGAIYVGPAVTCYFREPLNRQAAVADFLTEPPSMQLIIVLDKESIDEAKDSVLLLVAAVASLDNSDYAVVINGEQIALLRRKGVVQCDSSYLFVDKSTLEQALKVRAEEREFPLL